MRAWWRDVFWVECGVSISAVLVALLVVLYFLRGVIRVGKACLIVALVGVLVLLVVGGVLVLLAGVG